jgi:hypothetical protein
MQNNFKYGYWRTEKPKEDGFSHEIISAFYDKITPKTDLETLKTLPFEGVDTVLKAFERNVDLYPKDDYLGTRVNDQYQW